MSIPRGSTWKWGVCGLLLLATMINYMDRQVLSQSANRISKEFGFEEAKYGKLNASFGMAFAVGSLTFGFVVDKVNVRWVYPAGVLLWSIAGTITASVRNYDELMYCRIALGFFEATNWPCALRVTQRLLTKDERTMGNSILQSGAAVGAIITPFIVIGSDEFWSSWRYPFWFVGAMGLIWVAIWLLVVRSADLSLATLPSQAGETTSESKSPTNWWRSLLSIWSDRRFWVLMCVVIGINATWHFFKDWLPLYFEKVRGFSLLRTNLFSAAYYLFADIGAITAGFVTLRLVSRLRMPVHRSRLIVYLVFSLIILLSIPAAYAKSAPLVIGLFLLMGFGALGVFPNYYSFTQELSTRNQGKITGMLGFSCWASLYFIQRAVGTYLETTKKTLIEQGLGSGLDAAAATALALKQAYAPVIAWAGLPPLIGFFALLLFWRTPKQPIVDGSRET